MNRLKDITVIFKNMIESDDKNSISNQIGDVLYFDLLYRSFNEGLRLDGKNDKRPASLIDYIHKIFYENQTLRIRRLLDKGDDAYSLRRILNLIIANEHLYTRESYVCLDGIQYEIEQNKGIKEYECKFRHEKYDLLFRMNSGKRQKDDRLMVEYLEKIKEYLDKPNILIGFADQYVAHSLNKKKRKKTDQNLDKISLMQLQKNYKLLSWLSYTLSYYCNSLILFRVPVVTYDQFENWVGTLFVKDISKNLNKYWNKRADMFKSWEDKYWMMNDLYINPFTKVKRN